MEKKDEQVEKLLDSKNVDEIKTIIPNSTPTFAPTDAEDPYQFISQLKKFLYKREEACTLPQTGKSIFIYVPVEKRRPIENFGNEILKMFANPSLDISNKVYICLNSNLSKARFFSFNIPDDTLLWNELVKKQVEVEGLCGQDLCYACLDFSSKMATLHPEGDSSDPDLFQFSKARKLISVNELETFADALHEKETKYPNGATKIWANQSKLELVTQPEDRIVVRFKSSLEDLIGAEHVVYEPTKLRGRSDLVIQSSGMVSSHGPCILEFKVLFPKYPHARNVKWVWKGILQARDYSKDWGANNRYLMAYDARPTLTKIERLDELAEEHKVVCKFFRIFNNTSQERDEEIASIQDDVAK